LNLVWEQGAIGLTCAMGGAVVLLLLGTQILEWYWLAVLFAAGAACGLWRTLSRLPDSYTVAQQVDRRLGLHDALSTAWHFQSSDAAIAAVQREAASRMAASAVPAAAIPFRIPRHLYITCAVTFVAASLFLVRYGIRGSLDLRAPLVEAVADFFRPGRDVVARAKKSPKLPQESPYALTLDDGQKAAQDLDAASENALQETLTPDVDNLDTRSAERTQKANVKAQGEEGGEEEESGEEGEPGEGADSKQGAQGNGEPKDGAQQAAPKNQESSSLLDKMRDAMANLMSKLKIPPQAGQTSSAKNAKGQSAGKREQASQKGKQGDGQPQGEGAPSDDAETSAQAQGEQQAQAGQGNSADKGADQSASNESKSGMGKQDGDKALKDAEQLAAMGKLSEIFGKRAANVTGEVMVEVTSSKQQQLRTAYSKSGATHKESGGEIRRDEVPLELQQYVLQYFEKVRQAEQPARAPAQNRDR